MLRIINFCKFTFTWSLRMALKIKPQSTHLFILWLSPHAGTPSHQRDSWKASADGTGNHTPRSAAAQRRLFSVLSLSASERVWAGLPYAK